MRNTNNLDSDSGWGASSRGKAALPRGSCLHALLPCGGCLGPVPPLVAFLAAGKEAESVTSHATRPAESGACLKGAGVKWGQNGGSTLSMVPFTLPEVAVD